MRTLFASVFVSVLFTASAFDYNVSATVGGKDGETYYMTDYFRDGAVIDSATVVNGRLQFSGQYGRNAFVRVSHGSAYCNCILEQKPIVLDFNSHIPSVGGDLSMTYSNYEKGLEAKYRYLDSCVNEYKKKYPDPKEFEAEFSKFRLDKINEEKARTIALLKENADNGFGEFLLMSFYDYVDPADWPEFFASLPSSLTDLPLSRIKNKEMEASLKASPGCRFIDFDAKNTDGTPARLSDYVGKGKYVLVDFWASWCGPCRMEGRTTLKPLYEQYKDNDRIVFLGVGTWDKDSNTLEAIEQEGYAWPQIIGAGQEPMKLYGFNGIPMIMLFGPDGTIIARDIRGTGIAEAIGKALAE